MRFLRSSAIYASSSLINKAIPFFILPVLTRYLTPAEYGYVAVFQVLLTFVAPLVDMNISQNILRKYFKVDQAQMAAYLSNMLLLLAASFAVVMSLVACVSLIAGNLFGLPDRWIMVLPAIALMNMINKCNLVLLIQQSRPFTYGLYEIGNTVLNVSITLVLIVGYNWGWQGRTAGILVAAIVIGIIGLIHVWRRGYLKFRVSRKSIREILRVSLPLIPHVIGMVVIGFSDRLILDWMVGKEAVGLYTVGYQFGMIAMLFADAFLKSWSPWFFKHIEKDQVDEQKKIVRYTYLFLGFLFAAAILIAAGSEIVFPIMVDTQFAGGRAFIIWIALAYATRGIYQCMLLYALHQGKTGFLAVNTGFAAALNLGLNVVLIKANGPIGAAQASLISFAVMSLGSWWYATRIHYMPWLPGWLSPARSS